MRKGSRFAVFLIFAGLLLAGGAASAAPCDGYSRVVKFADGSARLAQGTACLSADGQWRVKEEHLTPAAAYYAPPRVAYAPAYYYPAAHYPLSPYFWPATFLFFSYAAGGYRHHHHGHHHHH